MVRCGVRKQILKVALKNFTSADFIAMNLRSNGKSMCFPSASQFYGPPNTHTLSPTHYTHMAYPQRTEPNQSDSQLMFYLALDTLNWVKVARGTKKTGGDCGK